MSNDFSKKTPTPIRGKGYSDGECLAIAKAMISAKNNPIKGSGQKLDDFHAHFKREFSKLQEAHWPDRQVSSLVEKYSLIRRDVAKFMGILKIVQGEKKKSGHVQSDQQDVEKAMAHFQLAHQTPFLYFHCYVIMKDQPMLGLKNKKEAWEPAERLTSGAAIKHGGSVQNRRDSYNSSSAAVPVRLFDADKIDWDDDDMGADEPWVDLDDAVFSSDQFFNEEWRTSSTQQQAQQQHQQNQDSEQFDQQQLFTLSQQQQQFDKFVKFQQNLQRRQHHSQV
jgi:hypothetical protein